MVDRTASLASVPLFAGLPRKTLERLSAGLVERHYPAGAEIVTEDRGGVAFFVIADGEADVWQGRGIAPGRTLRRGDSFGEIALIDGGARTATVRATIPSTCLAMTSWDFMAEVNGNIDLAVHLLKAMTARVRDLEARLAEAGRHRAGAPA